MSSWQNHCESSPGSFDECSTAPTGRPLTLRPSYRLPESTPTNAIYYYYSA